PAVRPSRVPRYSAVLVPISYPYGSRGVRGRQASSAREAHDGRNAADDRGFATRRAGTDVRRHWREVVMFHTAAFSSSNMSTDEPLSSFSSFISRSVSPCPDLGSRIGPPPGPRP